MKVKLELPQHSQPCHSVAVYAGTRYIEEHRCCSSKKALDLEVPDVEDVRFIHSPVNSGDQLLPPEFRAVCRVDGDWKQYKLVDAQWFGLPPLEVTNPCRKVDGEKPCEDAECQEDECECADE